MNPTPKVIGQEHVQAAVDAVLGIDASQAPTDAHALNERLTTPQAGVTDAVEFLFAQQKSKQLNKGLPFAYTLLEAAERAYPDEMKDGIKSKSFVTALAGAAVEAKAAASGDGTISGPLKERQPDLVGFLERQFAPEESWVRKLSQEDRAGIYALCLGTVRAIDRHLAGVEKPAQAAKEPGRNEPCSCGSGKKYKKCHGSAVRPDAPAAVHE